MRKLKTVLAIALFALCAAVSVFAMSGCGYCQHRLEEVPKVAATCRETGLRTAYKCTKCGKLFGYSDEKGGLYDIDEQEATPLGTHVISPDFKAVVPEGAENFADIHIENECSVCNEVFTISNDNLYPYAPCASDSSSVHKREENGNIPYTEFTFAAGSKENTKITVTYDDPSPDPLANTGVPFTSDAVRYFVVYFKNDGDVDVDLVYGTECYSERCQTPTTHVPAHGYAAAACPIAHTRTQDRCWFELYLKNAIDSEAKVGICGYYYEVGGRLLSVELASTGKTLFDEGEKIDRDTIAFKEHYDNGAVRVIPGSMATSSQYGKPLSTEDTEVEIEYRNKKYRYSITVLSSKRRLTLVGAEFADGTTTRLIDKNADVPNDVVRKKNAIFLYWTDVYGNKYPNVFNMGGNDMTVKAVYAGDSDRTNFALNKTCTASEPGFNPSGFGIEKLTDGRHTSFNAWGSNLHSEAAQNVWVEVDLEQVREINEVVLYERSDGAYFPKTYHIEVSEDGENYVRVFEMERDLMTANGNSFFGPRYCFFQTVSARFVRITATELVHGGSNDYYVEYAEIEVYNG